MQDFLEAIPKGIAENAELVWVVTILSAATFVGSLIAVPILLARIPADYFLHPPREQDRGWIARHPVVRVGIKIGKNLLGAVLVIAGLGMLVFPGQGLLTILIGVALLDLPGKRKLETTLLRQKQVRRAVDWIRRRAGRPPLRLPPKRQGAGIRRRESGMGRQTEP